MKRVTFLTFAAFAATAAASAADGPMARGFDKNLSSVESEFVSLAEAVPAAAYGFAPKGGEFKGVRTFAQQAKHVAAVNYLIGAAILGTKPPVETGGEAGPDSTASKEQIVAFLKASFAYLHQAMNSLDERNLLEQVPSPFGSSQTTRLALALEAAPHCFDHYGQMVVYARMNGIIPPASR